MPDNKLLKLMGVGLGGALIAAGQAQQGGGEPQYKKGSCTPCAAVKKVEQFRRRRGFGQ